MEWTNGIAPGTAATLYFNVLGFGANDSTVCVDHVFILGNEVNLPPQATDDMAETEQDTPVIVDVLANDTDPEGMLLPGTVQIAGDFEGTVEDLG